MPRYMIERSFGAITDEEMLAAALRSDRTMAERFPDITWEHSHVCVAPDGVITTYCIYTAPDEKIVREHSETFGGHSIINVQEIVDDVTPQEVRRRANA